ncbi:MAG: hypothetical protein JWL96_1984 [Sphingomonas bacterium]|uniref:hypothetical protein n=1 Tax=Sphingomonas bacterium TaxID=1895847 RepID=UPI00261B2D1F|nr:hypothetical protein [Sphingomonas bacterium]MDB5709914.1 hypothetical protein [Sphingomonas bacterium]
MTRPARSGAGWLRRLGRKGHLVLLAAAAPMAAQAASKPVVLDPVYIEPTTPVSFAVAGAPLCAVHIVEIVDIRRSPEMLGMLGGKPVLAPPDRTVWLISIVNGLKARGIAVDFSNPGVESPAVVNAHVTLQTAWIDAVQVSLNESAVFKIQAKGSDGRSIDQYYRGSASRMNWVLGDAEIKGGLNIAFSRALDAMARDLVGLCGKAASA